MECYEFSCWKGDVPTGRMVVCAKSLEEAIEKVYMHVDEGEECYDV